MKLVYPIILYPMEEHEGGYTVEWTVFLAVRMTCLSSRASKFIQCRLSRSS